MSFFPTKCLSASRVPGTEEALDKHIRWNAYQLLNISEVEVAPSHPREGLEAWDSFGCHRIGE